MLLTWASVVAILSMLFDPSVLNRATISATRELARDPEILVGLWAMLGRAQYGFSRMEEAAFVVAAPDGTLSLVRWPGTGMLDQSRWRGPLPRNAIAIVHTHPNSVPRPSRIDAQTAIETGLPVYVITRSTITKTSGRLTEVVTNKPWIPGKHQFPALVERRTPTRPARSSR